MRAVLSLFFSSFAPHLCSFSSSAFSSISSSSFLFPSSSRHSLLFILPPQTPIILLLFSPHLLPHYPTVPSPLLFHQPPPPPPPSHISHITNLSLLLSSPPLLPLLLKATCWATWVTHSSRRASWAVRSTVASSTSAPPSSRCRTCCCPTRPTSSASWYRSGKRPGPRSSPSASCCGWAQSTDVSQA